MMKHDQPLRIGDDRLIRDELINGVEVTDRASFGEDRQRHTGNGLALTIHELQSAFDIGKTAVPDDPLRRHQRNQDRDADQRPDAPAASFRRSMHGITYFHTAICPLRTLWFARWAALAAL